MFGIIEKLPFDAGELEPVRTIEYEYNNDNPKAWVRSDNFEQLFRYSPVLTILRVFKGVELTLGPQSSSIDGKFKTHFLVVKTSYKTYGVLLGIRKKGAKS
jgi:hypothetical protein